MHAFIHSSILLYVIHSFFYPCPLRRHAFCSTLFSYSMLANLILPIGDWFFRKESRHSARRAARPCTHIIGPLYQHPSG